MKPYPLKQIIAALLLPSTLLLTSCSNQHDHTLPAHPGEMANSTLQGVDANQNNLRDDIEIMLYERFAKRSQVAKRNALIQTAKSLQMAITAGDEGGIDEIYQASDSLNRSMKCLTEVFGVGASIGEIGYAEVAVVNTSARGAAYINFTEQLEGRKKSSFPNKTDQPNCD